MLRLAFIKRSTLLLAAVLCLQGCSKFLESYPKNNLSTGTFFRTEEEFTNAVNGIYDACQDGRALGFFPMTDMATPFALSGVNRFGQFHNGIINLTPGYEMSQTFWTSYYRIVFRANLVLEHIDNPDAQLSQKARNRLKGEALFLRSFAYFYLTQLFGDVPLVLKTQQYQELQVPKDPKAKVVDQLIADLKEAAAILPSVKEYRADKKLLGRASRGAAKALLGKLYVFEKRWADAETLLSELITDADYDLESKFSDMFWPDKENGIESIFEIQFSDLAGEGNSIVRFCAPITASGISSSGFNYINPTEYYTDQFETVNGFPVQSTFVKRELEGAAFRRYYNYASPDPAYVPGTPFEKRDPRLKWTLWYEGTPYIAEFQSRSGQTGITYKPSYAVESNHNTVKYIVGKMDKTGTDSPQNLIVLRYADVLLLYAEALLEQNKLGPATTWINKVRQRPSVAMPTVQQVETARGIAISTDQTALRKYLHTERYRELAFEWGHMYFDMVRWDELSGEMVRYWTAGKDGASNPALTAYPKYFYRWPLPAEEIARNPKLEQNPGY
ncbi:RagB/SusD family nutrient uptake outer membrane protein [Chitinophaga lutea]